MQMAYAREIYAEFGVPFHEQDALSWGEFLTMVDIADALRRERAKQAAKGA